MTHPQHCGAAVAELCRGAQSVIVVSPFITRPGLQPVLNEVSHAASLTVFTRWRPEEIARGASDPAVYEDVVAAGGTLRLHHLLHAKVYLADRRALVGSANTTLHGLGWDAPGALEILVPAAADDPAVSALMSLLDSTASLASREIRDAVVRRAEMAAAAEFAPLKQGGAGPASWLPSFRFPETLWHAYRGHRSPEVKAVVQSDLDALDIPTGIEDEETFNALVGAALLQGLPGRIAQECANLNTYHATQKLQRLAAAAGVALDDPGMAWERFTAWIGYFINDYRRTIGGTALLG
ncbi:MAG: hypothetical protein M3198_02655 [Actinomycetota bacterium]|nr:hypothetical protein [Actinomycetota bacterium]